MNTITEKAATVLDCLKAGKILVETGWTQGEFSRGADGKSSTYDKATCWCLAGAVNTSTSRMAVRSQTYRALRMAHPDRPDTNGFLVHWNDDPARKQEEVVALFQTAIRMEEANAQHAG